MQGELFRNNQFHYRSEQRGFSLYVCTVGHEHTSSPYHWGPAPRSYFLIHYLAQGKGTYVCKGISYEIAAGDTFVAYPSCVISLDSDPAQTWEYCWVGFSGSESATLLSKLGLTEETPILHTGVSDEIFNLYMSVGNVCGSRFSDAVAMSGRLYLLFSYLLEGYGGGSDAEGSDLFKKALDHIHQHVNETATPQSLCEAVGVSRSWLYRLFMKNIGISPTRYLTELKLNRACYYLRNTSLSVAEIAWRVGYADALYFSRVFTSVIGLPPSRFRRNNANSGGTGAADAGPERLGLR